MSAPADRATARGARDGAPPLVAVIMPAYNRARVIGRAVRSVLAQTMDDLELIVVDDGSTDDTVGIVTSFSDPRIRLVRLPENRGLSRARNEGIRLSRARFVAFLDSDDEWLPTALEQQTARLLAARPPAAVSWCHFWRHDETTDRTRALVATAPRREPFQAFARGWTLMPSCVVVERSALLEIGGFDPALPSFDDLDLWLRLARASLGFTNVPEALVVKHEHGIPQISSNPEMLVEGFRRLDRKWAAAIRAHAGAFTYYRWRARLHASTRYVRVRRALAQGHRLTAWREALRACRSLPLSTHYVSRSLALALVGLPGYVKLTRLKDAWHRRRLRS